MEDIKSLNPELLDAIVGGWSFDDLTREEQNEFDRLYAIYREIAKKAWNDPSYEAAAEEAYSAWDSYATYIAKKYEFLDKHRS